MSGAGGGRARGYAEIATAALVNGSIGVMVSYATMPAAMLLVLRMSIAGLAVGVVFFLGRGWRDLTTPGAKWKLAAIGVVVAANLLLYFLAIRYTGVAVAIFLSYMAPVYLAFVAPRLFGGRTEGIVYAALGIALAGMVVILVPGLIQHGARTSPFGLLCGWGAGVAYAGYLLLSKSLRQHQVRSTTIVFCECVVTALLVLPLGLAQTVGRYSFTGRDLLMAALLGLLTTAFSFSLFAHGLRYIRVQHASIMGYLEPVSAPFYAFLFLGQRPHLWTLVGGALIIAAGVLVVAKGQVEEEIYG